MGILNNHTSESEFARPEVQGGEVNKEKVANLAKAAGLTAITVVLGYELVQQLPSLMPMLEAMGTGIHNFFASNHLLSPKDFPDIFNHTGNQ